MAKLGQAQAQFAANLVTEAKRKIRASNSAIADIANCNEKTVREVLSGKCLIRETVERVCRAVEIDLHQALKQASLLDESSGTAAGRLGGYSKEIYAHLIGQYTTIRCSYADEGVIKCYRTTIEWDIGTPALQFNETFRHDAQGQTGHIYIPSASPYMYLMTISRGWIRTVLVSQLVDGVLIDSASSMRGLILSQYNSSGANYAPVCTPIVYLREKTDQPEIPYGEIDKTQEHYGQCVSLLEETLSKCYVKMLLPSTR